mmetsp:Transcript_12953/g.29822  ORF Transcript_12953/g.29822 Transcript_12953/m.29822 type:complete len:222 (-) Transcript_12953:345-1010(-)
MAQKHERLPRLGAPELRAPALSRSVRPRPRARPGHATAIQRLVDSGARRPAHERDAGGAARSDGPVRCDRRACRRHRRFLGERAHVRGEGDSNVSIHFGGPDHACSGADGHDSCIMHRLPKGYRLLAVSTATRACPPWHLSCNRISHAIISCRRVFMRGVYYYILLSCAPSSTVHARKRRTSCARGCVCVTGMPSCARSSCHAVHRSWLALPSIILSCFLS